MPNVMSRTVENAPVGTDWFYLIKGGTLDRRSTLASIAGSTAFSGVYATITALNNHIASGTAHAAASITFVPTGSITATDVQAAIVAAAGSGGGIAGVRVEDEGVSVVPAATALNFAGAGVSVVNAGLNEATVSIPGGSGSGGQAVYEWSGAAYTRIDGGGAFTTAIFLDVSGGNNPTTSPGGRSVDGDRWVTGEAALTVSSTFSNANYTVPAGYRFVQQIATLSASRTVTLPAASTLPAGQVLTIANRGDVGAYALSIVAAGADTVTNPGDLSQATVKIRTKDAVRLASDGVSRWFVVNPGTRRPYSWWQHPRDLAIPTDKWVPVPWNSVLADEFNISPRLQTTATTVAAASDTVVLPTGTINVVSTTGFSSSGCIVITGPPGSGDDTIVHYTGITATSFTGCNTASGPNTTYAAGISTGTLATGQVVTQANVEFFPPTGYLWQSIVELAMENVPTTAYWSIKFVDTVLGGCWASMDYGGLNIPLQHGICTMQPGQDADTGSLILVKQTSGSTILCKKDATEAPSIMQAMMSSR